MTTPSAPDKRPARRAAPPAPHPAWRAFWGLVALVGFAAEGGALKRVLPGDTASETVTWTYGPAWELRWWALGMVVAFAVNWCWVHWMFPNIGWRWLVVAVTMGLIVALVGWLITG